MKASVAWINAYLSPGDLTGEQAQDLLTFAGLPIDSTTPLPGGDVQLEVELTSNRGDCLSHVGLAREVAALSGRGFTPPASAAVSTSAGPSAGASAGGVGVENRCKAAGCPAFVLYCIRGVKVGPSPQWLRTRLEAIGQRSINNVVDVTNFVLHELGQPSHVFDRNAVAGSALVVRPAAKGEKLPLLDGQTITLGGGELVICDGPEGARPISLAGVMGGSATAVSERTSDVLLEVATWDPVLVRLAARRHNLRTDAGHRYERFVDQRTMPAAAARLIELLLEVAGGKVEPTFASGKSPDAPATQVTLRARRLESVLGLAIDAEVVERILRAHGFGVQAEGGPDGAQWRVVVPAHRHDVKIEVDLIEEVIRTHGYDKLAIPEVLGVRVAPLQGTEQGRRELTRVLTGLGYFEALTFSFTSGKQAEMFLPAGMQLVRVSDGRRGEEGVCRPSVLPGLLACRRANQDARVHAEGGVRLFEIAAVFAQDASTGASAERRVLALLADAPPAGSAMERKQGAIGTIRGSVERAVYALAGGGAGLAFVPQSAGGLPGVDPSATIMLAGKPIGVLGLASAQASALYDLQGPVALAEVQVQPLLEAFPPRSAVRELPTTPAVERDLSLIVGEGVLWSQIEGVLSATRPALIESWRFLGTYRGKPLNAGHKSVTLRMTFRDPTRTLRDEEVTPQVQAVVGAMQSQLGATLRV